MNNDSEKRTHSAPSFVDSKKAKKDSSDEYSNTQFQLDPPQTTFDPESAVGGQPVGSREGESELVSSLEDSVLLHFEKARNDRERYQLQITQIKSLLNVSDHPLVQYCQLEDSRDDMIDALSKELRFRKQIRETYNNEIEFESEVNDLVSIRDRIRNELTDWSSRQPTETDLLPPWTREEKQLSKAKDYLHTAIQSSQKLKSSLPKVKPDSQQVDKLLPPVSAISDGMHFVGREPSMLQLLDIHWSLFAKRRKRYGRTDQIPLVDSVYGMGKTTFAVNYLALFASYLKKKKSLDKRYSKEFIDELSKARTLHIQLDDDLFGPNRSKDEVKRGFAEQLMKAARLNWGSTPPTSGDTVGILNQTIEWISSISPVFIVVDEIGSAAEEAGTSLVETRGYFMKFVKHCCRPMARQNRVYFALCGRAAFLSLVGLRPNSDYIPGSPVTFVRVNLNPILPDHIMTILHKTKPSYDEPTYFDCLMERGMNPEDFCSKLYDATGGHPRTLNFTLCKQDWFNIPPTDPEAINLDDVYEVLNNYASYIRLLYDFARSSSEIDLTAFISAEPKQPTFEYLATRIYAGFGLEKTKTTIFIMPTIMRVLDEYFLGY